MARLQCLVQTEEVVVLGHLPMVWASIRRAHMILLLLLFLLLLLHNYRLWLSSSLVLFIPYNQSIESIAKDVLTFLTFSWRSVMSKMSMRSRDYQLPKVPSVVLSPSPLSVGEQMNKLNKSRCELHILHIVPPHDQQLHCLRVSKLQPTRERNGTLFSNETRRWHAVYLPRC